MAADPNHLGNNLQVNPQAPVHGYAHSQPPSALSRYQSSPAIFAHNPISHFSNQYTAAHSTHNKNIYYRTKNASIQPQTESNANDMSNAAPSDDKAGHERTSSQSYIQQRQQAFFSESPIEPTCTSETDDDDVYDEMYGDELRAKRDTKGGKNKDKSRDETEDVWCCSVCTYQNNMFLTYCELCGCKKPNDPSIVKRVVYSKEKKKEPDHKQDERPVEQPDERPDEQPQKKTEKKPRQIHRYAASAMNVLSSSTKHWQCPICTFSENPMSRPVCKMCSALPPEQPPSPNVAPADASTDIIKQKAAPIDKQIHTIEEIDTDPLGHQKSTSITHMAMVDESKVMKQEQLRGLQAHDVVPDLPAEAVVKSGGGIFGFFGKVSNGWSSRKRSQSEDVKQDKEQLKDRNISVATMPKKQEEKIAKRLGGLHTKKDLLRELESSSGKLQKKLKQHAAKVMQLRREISDLEHAKERDLAQWNAWYILELVDLCREYYETAISLKNDEIELAKLHIECFTEKLQRLSNANEAIRRNGRKWNVDDIRNNIEVAFHTAWRIRLSQDVPDKQDYVKQLSAVVAGLGKNYSSKCELLGRNEVSMEERKESIFLFLQSTLAKYESNQMARDESFKLSVNLQNENDFYCPYCEADQNVFDSFVLDERTKEGRIVSRWLIFVAKKHRQISFCDFCDFLQKLAHTLLHSYSLPSKQYYECVRILCYRCILRRKVIRKIIFDLLSIECNEIETDNKSEIVVAMKQIALLDDRYQKKVMWMRALNETQLGIKDDYWFQRDNSKKIKGKRRSSQIALLAGRDIPFAESINLMGQLQVDAAIVARYREMSTKTAKKESQSRWMKKKKAKKIEETGDARDVIPFVLPQTALQLLLSATKSIYQTAMIYYYKHYPSKENDVNDDSQYISQDDLFPIILYCVIQSKLETPHKVIHFIESILPQEKTTMGQSAFALSALKAAVEYISQANPTTFGMDAEIELD
eukprot:259152_1